MNKNNVVEVQVSKKANGKFAYTGVTEDGSLVALRKSATRLYEYAYFYEEPVASGSSGLAAHFLYGKNKPSAQWNGEPARIFRVKTLF